MAQTLEPEHGREETEEGEKQAASTRLYSIGDLAAELDVTQRALRLYETQGLLSPQRIGGQRVYSHRDRARLVLILRGKRLGFSLADIKEMLELYHVDPDHLDQLRATLKIGAARMADLERQQQEIALTLKELRAAERVVRDLIAQKESQQSR
jgi:DNA-binding transcriptional MerR regulator